MAEENTPIQAPEENNIAETGSITAKTSRGTVHCITIVGQIEGHMELPAQNKTTKYEHIMPALVAIEQDESIEGLVIILNTVGGDIEAGLAIAELIAGMKKQLVQWFWKYTDPAVDAAHERVTGFGQMCRPGIYADRTDIFCDMPK